LLLKHIILHPEANYTVLSQVMDTIGPKPDTPSNLEDLKVSETLNAVFERVVSSQSMFGRFCDDNLAGSLDLAMLVLNHVSENLGKCKPQRVLEILQTVKINEEEEEDGVGTTFYPGVEV
jgi:hypothetical protein